MTIKGYFFEESSKQKNNTDYERQVQNLINKVYEQSEYGLWKDDHIRITKEKVREIISKQGFYILKDNNGKIIACIHLKKREDGHFEIGLLAVSESHRRKGLGSQLIEELEKKTEEMGKSSIYLRVLRPIENSHKGKKGLAQWYKIRHGYKQNALVPVSEDKEFPKAHLKVKAEFLEMKKNLKL